MLHHLNYFAVFIAIFLFGMTMMRIGLYHLSHHRLRAFLLRITDSPVKGMIISTIMTAILQSSSAVMIITIGFIASGLLSFKQSIGIILGTNIGTTFTTEFITLDLDYFILPLLWIGAVLLFTKNHISFHVGTIFFGISCLFIAMNGFNLLAKPLASNPIIHSSIMISNENFLIGIGFGTLLTAILQSSTATTGIIMGFLNEHLISLSSGIAIIFGANIGTCVTAYIASIGANKEAKLAAFAHIWLNIFGVILCYPLIPYFASIASLFSTLPDAQLAHVSVLFNLFTSMIALPFTSLFSNFIQKIHG